MKYSQFDPYQMKESSGVATLSLPMQKKLQNILVHR